MSDPDFNLASSEGYDLESPRRAWRVKRLSTDGRDDLLLLKVDPPLLGQKFGLGSRDVDMVLVATRIAAARYSPLTSGRSVCMCARMSLSRSHGPSCIAPRAMLTRSDVICRASRRMMKKQPESTQVSHLQFLGEQDGLPERELEETDSIYAAFAATPIRLAQHAAQNLSRRSPRERRDEFNALRHLEARQPCARE
jgi:hypothetical protein